MGKEDFVAQRTPSGRMLENTGLVQESNQVRLGATSYPMA